MSEKFEVIPPGGAEAPPAADPKAKQAAAPKKNAVAKETAETDALTKALAEVEELKAKLAASQQATIDSLTKRIEELEAGKKSGKTTPKAELKNALAVEDAKDLIPVDVDLAPNARFLLIDGTAYQHGLTYYVTPVRAQTINEMCARTWSHEQEIGLTRRGPSNNFQHRPAPRNYDTTTHAHLVQGQAPAPSLEGVQL